MKKKIKKLPEPPSCIYNPGVTCFPKNRVCDKCGWNPTVEKKRKEGKR